MKTKYLSLAILSALLLTGCGKRQKEVRNDTAQLFTEEVKEVAITEKQLKIVDIELGEIEHRELNNIVRANGELTLDPQDQAMVTALIGGIVKEIVVREGAVVRKGQLLALVENTEIVELQKNYLTTLREKHNAELNYNRQKELSEQGAGVAKNYEAAVASYGIAKAQLLGIEKQLKQLGIDATQVANGNVVTSMPIIAPISGYVSRLLVMTGAYVDSQTPIVNITDNRKVHCDLKVFEKDINKVKVGQEVDIRLTNQGTSLKGRVYEINKSFNDATKSITVHIAIDNGAKQALIPEAYVTGAINVGKLKTTALPTDAIVSSEGKKYIFVLEKEVIEDAEKFYHFKQAQVMTGTTELGYTEIVPVVQVADGAIVVRKNAFYLASMVADHGEH